MNVYDSNGRHQTDSAVHGYCYMHPNHAHRLWGVRHPLEHRQRDSKRSVPSGDRHNRGYPFHNRLLRLHSLVIHPLTLTDMAKRSSRTAAQQCRYYEVDNIFEYMVSVYLNGNISAFGELYKELNRQDRKEFIIYLFSEVEPIHIQEIILATI